MLIPIDTELVAAGVYVVAVPLYLLLWRHSRHWYVALAVAAAILALCALLRSDTVRAWNPPALHHHDDAPLRNPGPSSGFGLVAGGDSSGCPEQVRA